jgi:hypothetical protein
MRRHGLVLLMLCLAVSPVLFAARPIAQTAGELTLFFDDFEGTPAGHLPSGWQVIYNGRGTQYQVVSNAYAYSGSQSLQQWGMPGWSAVTRRTFTSDSPLLGYEYAILIETQVAVNTLEHPAFYGHRAENYWGTYYAMVCFRHMTGVIASETGVTLGTWAPGSWYRVRVVLDRTARTYSVWIDGSLAGANLPIYYLQPERIDSFAALSAHAGVRVFYDDVRVFVPASADTLGLLRSEIAALRDAGAINGGQANALTVKLDQAIARLGEGRVAPAIGILRALIHQLSDLVVEGVLTPEQAQPLIALVNSVLDQLA